MGFSFVHSADLHLGASFSGIKYLPKALQKRVLNANLVAFERVIDFCLSANINFLVLAGDTFHDPNPSLRIQRFFLEQIKRLAKANIDVFMVTGNHDAQVFHNLVVELPTNLYTFPSGTVQHYRREYHHCPITIYGINYPQAAVKENLLPLFPKPTQDSFALGILHCEVGGSHESTYSPVSSNELNKSGYNYWALGHVHTAVSDPNHNWHYPGTVQGLHRLEEGEKGFYYVTYQAGIINTDFIPAQDLIWQTCTVDLSQVQIADLSDVLLEQKEEFRQAQAIGTLVEMVLAGNTEMNLWLNNENEINDLLEMLQSDEEYLDNFVWVTQLTNETKPLLDLNELQNQGDFLAEVLHLLDQLPNTNAELFEELWEPLRNNGLVVEPEQIINNAKLQTALLLRGDLE